jgi:hypothetical protein
MMSPGIVPMALSGASVSLLAPILILLPEYTGLPWDWDRIALPARWALPLFLVGHAVIMIGMTQFDLSGALEVCLHVVLVLGAIEFWLPILGRRRRLSDPVRSAYLFLAAPTLDLAGVWIVAVGDSPGGLAMIVAMLPIGVAAVLITWRWMAREESLARDRERSTTG